jgi:plastocyanin
VIILRRLVREQYLIAVAALAFLGQSGSSWAAPAAKRFFLPQGTATRILSVAPVTTARPAIVVMTLALATRESGPTATIKRFGEVYAFSPSTIAVHQNEPTIIALWNLQADDEHDFAIIGPDDRPLMDVQLPPDSIATYKFTFHRHGLYAFRCLIHQPEMSGQIMVLPPAN